MIIQSKKVWVMGQFIPAQIKITEDKIERIQPYASEPADKDYQSLRLVPGFIDVHTHGAYGYDTNEPDPEGLRNWMRRIPEEGVTSILPTTVTQSPVVLTGALMNVAKVVEEGYEGAQILGIHFEGPFLSMEYKGAQPPEHIAEGTPAAFDQYQKAARGLIKYITLAPEEDEDLALTRYCAQHGVVVSVGHSGADYDTAVMAIANGATSMTHVFNGMTGLHHRKPGITGAAMRCRDVYGEIICDGCHIELPVLNTYFAVKGRDYGIMITDSLCAKNGPKKDYEIGGHPYTLYEDGSAQLSDGTLAGSTLMMNQGLRILAEEAMVPFDTALNACTINPARCLRVDDRKGKLSAGYDADIVVLRDDYSVEQTYCRGKAMVGQ